MTYVSAAIRREVIARARNCCEYCRLSQENETFAFHIEHVIAEKHGGLTTVDNLALSCPDCNFHKGSDLSSIDWEASEEVIPLYNPRKHLWADHFRIQGNEVAALTPQGRVTVFLLQLNDVDRLTERELLIRLGQYPCE